MELNTPLACLAVAIGTAGGAFLLSSIKKRKEVKKEESVEQPSAVPCPVSVLFAFLSSTPPVFLKSAMQKVGSLKSQHGIESSDDFESLYRNEYSKFLAFLEKLEQYLLYIKKIPFKALVESIPLPLQSEEEVYRGGGRIFKSDV